MKSTILFREFVLSLLDTENGITEEAYVKLQSLEAAAFPNSCGDIFLLVDAANGFFFLPSDHGLDSKVI